MQRVDELCSLAKQETNSLGCQTGEGRRKHDTDISDVDRDVEEVQGVVDDAGGDHQAWIHCPANDTAERVPCGLQRDGRSEMSYEDALKHAPCQTNCGTAERHASQLLPCFAVVGGGLTS